MQVRDVMTSTAVSVGPGGTAAAAARVLAEHRFTAVPVVEDGDLVGIVTEIDLLHSRVRHEVAHDVRNRLEHCAVPVRWRVDVHDGVVTLGDPCEDETERHIAAVHAGSVRGVIGVHVAATPA